MPRKFRVLFAEDSVKLAALMAQPHYAGWTFFQNPLSFSSLEADHNFNLAPVERADLSILSQGVFTVGFKA
jgi:hypothetical protein